MFKKRLIRTVAGFLALFLSFIIPAGWSKEEALTAYECAAEVEQGGGRVAFSSENASEAAVSISSLRPSEVKVGSRILELFFGKDKAKERLLIPGGDVFGARICRSHVTVTDSEGLPSVKAGDIILSVNGREVRTVEDVRSMLADSGGESVTLRVSGRDGERLIEAMPRFTDGEYRLGLGICDAAAGIGTVTFIDPETGVFGGLGHGICDSESGEIIEMSGGDVTGVILGGVHRGEAGSPGELCGVLTDEDLGDLTSNNGCGVFGTLKNRENLDTGAAIPVADRSEVHIGEAALISTVKGGHKAEYKIEITEIDRSATGSKSFRIRVTDPTLIALTGGIVRGMSGSPIIQNGKLVGAVTHVLINDPTTGYGIFIENMLNAAQIPMTKAS